MSAPLSQQASQRLPQQVFEERMDRRVPLRVMTRGVLRCHPTVDARFVRDASMRWILPILTGAYLVIFARGFEAESATC